MPVVTLYFLGWQVTRRVLPYVRRPFPSEENRQISERDDLGPTVVPGAGDRLRILKPSTERAVSKERLVDWHSLMEV